MGFKNINLVIAAGSVDGVLTAAAVVRNAPEGAEVFFTQAFTVNTVKPEDWEENRRVLFVDLAVNNRDPGRYPVF